ncbi:MAG: OmpW family outer membrane protein [Pseudomonadota bacterium]
MFRNDENNLGRSKPTYAGAILLVYAIYCEAAGAQSASDSLKDPWFGRAWGGFSSLSDTSGSSDGFQLDPSTDSLSVDTSGGFAAGTGVGYRFTDNFAAELAWEYRSNDSEVDFDSGASFDDGNYASSTFFLNGYYYLPSRGAWEPYLGLGLAWAQEIDIDLEGNGPEQSFSGDGDVGIQVFAGVSYRINPNWSAQGELRYGRITGLDLKGEGNPGTISDFDYEPLTLQIGLKYEF